MAPGLDETQDLTGEHFPERGVAELVYVLHSGASSVSRAIAVPA
jgi:hypothetical protein